MNTHLCFPGIKALTQACGSASLCHKGNVATCGISRVRQRRVGKASCKVASCYKALKLCHLNDLQH